MGTKKILLPAETVFIIDGSHFLFRAFYGIRPLTTKDGTTVHAVYGFCRMIKKLFETYNPRYMVLVWDSKGPTFRHEMYDAYKKNRRAMPDELKNQQALIRRFADELKIAQIEAPGVEADDLMYSLAKKLEAENQPSVILTADKDLSQAVTQHITIIDPFKNTHITKNSLEQQLGFALSKLPFYYGLVGDSSDNIPGVKGIGPQAAQSLVTQFESLEHVYQNIDQVSSERIKKLLIESKDNAFMSTKLFTLKSYDLTLSKESCAVYPSRWLNAYPLFRELGFDSLIKDDSIAIEQEHSASPLSTKYQFILVNTPYLLAELCKELIQHKRCAIDTEGTSLNPLRGRMVGLSICIEEGKSYYIPFGHSVDEEQLNRQRVFKELRPLLEDPRIEKYLHHAKFDALMFHRAGIHLQGIAFDTLIAAHLLVSDGQRIGLKHLSEYYLNEPMLSFNDVVQKRGYKNFAQVPLDIATQYAAADAHQTMRLYNLFTKALEHSNVKTLFYSIEMPMVRILFEMEKEGIFLCTKTLDAINVGVTQELDTLRSNIISLLGPSHKDLNLNSPKQVEKLLFGDLQLNPVKKTAGKRSYSTDNEVLQFLGKEHPIPLLIARYRELIKIKSTYIVSLSKHINPDTGRIHTSFHQTTVTTGRLASSYPNLQNIPVSTSTIRSAFKPKPGYVFISADYSQIELRVLAQLSQDATLITAFNEHKDIHTMTAAHLLGTNAASITPQQREMGKRINFSILYGITPYGLAKELDVSHAVAQNYRDTFMAQFPGIQEWMEKTVQCAHDKGYVETLFGRRRYLEGIHASNKAGYERAQRAAINTVAQATAAEIVKLGMVNVRKAIEEHALEAQLVVQIHDELLIQVAQSSIERATPLIIEALENVVDWLIPFTVTLRIGKNWQEVTK